MFAGMEFHECGRTSQTKLVYVALWQHTERLKAMARKDSKVDFDERLDYHAVLGVASGVSAADLTRAYRTRALLEHPDKNPTDRDGATRRFQAVKEAYLILSDPAARAVLERCGNALPPRRDDGGTPDRTANGCAPSSCRKSVRPPVNAPRRPSAVRQICIATLRPPLLPATPQHRL